MKKDLLLLGFISLLSFSTGCALSKEPSGGWIRVGDNWVHIDTQDEAERMVEELEQEAKANAEHYFINFEFFCEGDYDTSSARQRWDVEENTQVTFTEYVDSQKSLDYLAERYSFTYLEDFKNFDFENGCLFLSFGRKIVQLDGVGDVWHDYDFSKEKAAVRFMVTFEESHLGERVFFYRIDKRNYSNHDDTEYYIMAGLERIYWGEGNSHIIKSEAPSRADNN